MRIQRKPKIPKGTLCVKCGTNPVRWYTRKDKDGSTKDVVHETCGDCFYSDPEKLRKKFETSLKMKKKCKRCGTSENLRINNLGKMSICNDCYSEHRKDVVAPFIHSPDYIEKQKTSYQKVIAELTPEWWEWRNKKTAKGFQEFLKSEEGEKYREEVSRRKKEWWAEKTPEEWKISVDKLNSWKSDPEKRAKATAKMRATKLAWSPEKKREVVRKAIQTTIRDSERSKTGRFISKVEKAMVLYLREHGHEVLIQQEEPLTGCFMDAYLPALDLWVEMRGVYWHGYLAESLSDMLGMRRSRQGRSILSHMRADRVKEALLPNYIWISDIEFLDDPARLLAMIQQAKVA